MIKPVAALTTSLLEYDKSGHAVKCNCTRDRCGQAILQKTELLFYSLKCSSVGAEGDLNMGEWLLEPKRTRDVISCVSDE